MNKYYYFLNDKWKGPLRLSEINKIELADSTVIWYPELCTNQKVLLPSKCTCKKKTLGELNKKKTYANHNTSFKWQLF